MNVALVYDHVNKIGGAERILLALHELFPKAPLYTLVYDKKKAPWADSFTVVTSLLQKIPIARGLHELFPLFPIFAFEQFDFSHFDVVISVTSAEAKAIITPPKVLHISYLLTPTRFLWSHYYDYFANPHFATFTLPLVTLSRIWDRVASSRPDHYITISQTVASRIRKYYKREAEIIYPPVDTDLFQLPTSPPTRDYYLIVSRLVSYKHLEIPIKVCNNLRLSLFIVGEGLTRKSLEHVAGSTVHFLGNLTDHELVGYYQNCRALLFPQEEDFGISAVESLACGSPVIAYRSGAAVEILKEGVSGEFFYPQTREALEKTLRLFETKKYDATLLRSRALHFSKENFSKKFRSMVRKEWIRFTKS